MADNKNKKEKKAQTPASGSGKNMTRYDRKMQMRREQKEREKRNKKIAVGVLAAACVAAAAGIGAKAYGSWQAKNGPYFMVGDQEIKKAEFDFYYNSSIRTFENNYGSYASYLGLDTSKPLDQQPYADGMSWEDYFQQQAVDQIQTVHALKTEAEKAGFSYDSSKEADAAVQTVKTEADAAEKSVDEYCQQIYGEYATEDLVKQYTADSALASAYYTKVGNETEVSSDEIMSYYDEHKDDYDSVDYLLCTIKADVPSDEDSAAAESDSESETETMSAAESEAEAAEKQKQTDAAMAQAKKTAQQMLDSVSDENSFKNVYSRYASDPSSGPSHVDSEKTDVISSDVADWLFDSSRKAGDKTVIENTTTNEYNVVLFQKRYRDENRTVDVRHILITADSIPADEQAESETEETAAQTQTTSQTTQTTSAQDQQTLDAEKEKAEEIYKEWKDSGASEDKFAELAKKYSQDTGSASEGGLLEKVQKGQMVESFNNWIFDAARKPGDSGLIQSDYGWHIMYFVGQDVPAWQAKIEDTLQSQKLASYLADKKQALEVSDEKGHLHYLKVKAAESESQQETALSGEETSLPEEEGTAAQTE